MNSTLRNVLQTLTIVAVAFALLGLGSYLIVLAAQRADEINFAAVARLLGLSTGFVLLAGLALAIISAMSETFTRAIERRLNALRIQVVTASQQSAPFLIVFPFILIFLVEMQASEYGNTSLLARSAIGVTALSGIMVQAKFDNTRIHWRAASMGLLLAAPLAFWGLVIADKLSAISDEASQREGLLARSWDYASEMTAESTNVEVAVAASTVFFIAVGLAWALWPRRKQPESVA